MNPVWTLLAIVLVACGGSPPAGTQGVPALESGTLPFRGRTRTYLLARPVASGPQPLVIAFHGRLGDGEGMDRLSRLAVVAAREGSIGVFPDGTRRSWADARGVTPASKQRIDDVGFPAALINYFVAHRGADSHRIYMVGLAPGADLPVTGISAKGRPR